MAATYVSPGPPAAVIDIHRGRNNITIKTGLGQQQACNELRVSASNGRLYIDKHLLCYIFFLILEVEN